MFQKNALQKITSSLKHFWEKSKASSIVSTRKRELRDAIAEPAKVIDRLYQLEYPSDHLFAPIAQVVEEFDRVLVTEMGLWRKLDVYMAPDGTSVEYVLLADMGHQTFYKGQLGSPFKPLSMVASMREGMLAREGRTEPVSVQYQAKMKVQIATRTTGGVAISTSTQEMIDPFNMCFDLTSGNYRAPSLMHLRFGGDPGQQLMSMVRSRVRQDKPSKETWAERKSIPDHPEVIAASAKIELARERLARAEADLKALG